LAIPPEVKPWCNILPAFQIVAWKGEKLVEVLKTCLDFPHIKLNRRLIGLTWGLNRVFWTMEIKTRDVDILQLLGKLINDRCKLLKLVQCTAIIDVRA
jgi:hypothetical protein